MKSLIIVAVMLFAANVQAETEREQQMQQEIIRLRETVNTLQCALMDVAIRLNGALRVEPGQNELKLECRVQLQLPLPGTQNRE